MSFENPITTMDNFKASPHPTKKKSAGLDGYTGEFCKMFKKN